MATGKVKWFDSKKGYGFIKDNDSEKDIFLHVTSLEKSKLRVLKENQEIEENQPLAVIEAMKMENIIKSEKKTKIKKINCSEGDSLEVDQIILEFE